MRLVYLPMALYPPLRTAVIVLSILLVCNGAKAHHFPPGLEGELLAFSVDGYLVEVLILPSAAEVNRTTGILISVKKAGTEQYYTGSISLVAMPTSGLVKTKAVKIETAPRPDLQGDREGRHIFREPGGYVLRIGFQPEDKPLAVEFPLDVVAGSGPNPLYLGLIVAVFVGAIFIVGLIQKLRGRDNDKKGNDVQP